MNDGLSNRMTVVTLTPLPINSDSRTFKQAASVARLGYRSIVLEGPSSALDPKDLPFELVATSEPLPVAAPIVETPATEESSASPVEPDAEATADAAQSNTIAESLKPTGAWDQFRKRVREQAEEKIGNTRFISFLWLVEHKGRNFVNNMRNDRFYLFKLTFYLLRYLFFWIRFYLFHKPKSIIIIFCNRVIYSYINNFRRHIFNYFSLYLFKTLNRTPVGDLYYLHSFYQYPAVYFRCKFRGSRYIYDAHDFYSEMDGAVGVSTYWRDWVMPFQLKVERACVRNAAVVVTVNEGIAELMKQKFGREVVVLRNSHDARLETPVPQTIRDVLGLSEDAVLVVCVGQWKRDTAIPQAIEAFASLPAHFHLAFLGKGFPSYHSELAAKRIAGRVHFVPAVKPTEVVPFIRSADIGLLLYHPVSPSIRNCLPNGFFQPTAAGLPILYPRLPEIARVAERHDLGLPIDPLDPASIAQGIQALGSNDALLRAKKANVLAAQHAMSWERDEEQLKTIIEGLIGPPLQRRATS